MHPEIKQFEVAEWPAMTARLIHESVTTITRQQRQCSVMLTGGRSASSLYSAWSDLPAFMRMDRVKFYFGDERCVPPDHPESNYGLAMRTLFKRGVPTGCGVFRMEADNPDREAAANKYGDTMPMEFDVMLLGVGEDGHIASLFPGSAALHETNRYVVPITAPKPPRDRLTITPPVIRRTKSIFLLATGPVKAAVLSKALQAPADLDSFPVRLALNATWVLDTALSENISR